MEQTSSSPAVSKRVIQWDEVTIAEHDKERGTRQKIDEPPTPYRYHSGSERSDSGESGCEGENERDGSFVSTTPPSRASLISGSSGDNRSTLDWSTLHAKLNYEKHLQLETNASTDQSTSSPSSPSSKHRDKTVFSIHTGADGDSGENEVDPIVSKKFKDKRAAHYNEWAVIQAMRKQQALDSDEDDIDGDCAAFRGDCEDNVNDEDDE